MKKILIQIIIISLFFVTLNAKAEIKSITEGNVDAKVKLIVFDRHGYKKKSLNSMIYKRLGEKRVFFIKFNKVNISSSQLKKI